MENNAYYNQPMGMNMGYGYGMPQQPYNYGIPYAQPAPMMQPNTPKMTMLLDPNEINTLKRNNSSFNINVQPEDILRSKCVHRDGSNFTVTTNDDGTYTCYTCGETFTPVYNADDQDIQTIINQILNILNTIKLTYLDMPVDMGRELFPIMELIKKLPALYKIAMNNFNRYTNLPVGNQYANNGQSVNSHQ